MCLMQDIVISFSLAAGHNVGRVFLNIAALPLKWLILSVEFVNKDDPEKIRNALTASAVSLYQRNNNFYCNFLCLGIQFKWHISVHHSCCVFDVCSF